MAHAKQRLLIVDDDRPIRHLLKRLAQRAGFDADTAKDGRDAIENLNAATYDIVIIDLMMPRVSGFELVQHINTLDPRPTVIVATAMMNGDIARIDDSMIRRVIRKPFDIDTVMKALIETAAELAAGREVGSVPLVIKEIIPGDSQPAAAAAAELIDARESSPEAQPSTDGAQGRPDKPA